MTAISCALSRGGRRAAAWLAATGALGVVGQARNRWLYPLRSAATRDMKDWHENLDICRPVRLAWYDAHPDGSV